MITVRPGKSNYIWPGFHCAKVLCCWWCIGAVVNSIWGLLQPPPLPSIANKMILSRLICLFNLTLSSLVFVWLLPITQCRFAYCRICHLVILFACQCPVKQCVDSNCPFCGCNYWDWLALWALFSSDKYKCSVEVVVVMVALFRLQCRIPKSIDIRTIQSHHLFADRFIVYQLLPYFIWNLIWTVTPNNICRDCAIFPQNVLCVCPNGNQSSSRCPPFTTKFDARMSPL